MPNFLSNSYRTTISVSLSVHSVFTIFGVFTGYAHIQLFIFVEFVYLDKIHDSLPHMYFEP